MGAGDGVLNPSPQTPSVLRVSIGAGLYFYLVNAMMGHEVHRKCGSRLAVGTHFALADPRTLS